MSTIKLKVRRKPSATTKKVNSYIDRKARRTKLRRARMKRKKTRGWA